MPPPLPRNHDGSTTEDNYALTEVIDPEVSMNYFGQLFTYH